MKHPLVTRWILVWGIGWSGLVTGQGLPIQWHLEIKGYDVQIQEEGTALLATSNGVLSVGKGFEVNRLSLPTLYRFYGKHDAGHEIEFALQRLGGTKIKLHQGAVKEGKGEVMKMGPYVESHQAQDGAFWVWDPRGTRILRIKGGERSDYDVQQDLITKKAAFSRYNPLYMTESPKGQLAFYQHFGHYSHGKSMEGILVWSDGQMRVFELGKGVYPGFVEFLDEERLCVGSQHGIVVYDLESGVERERFDPPPGFFQGEVRPVTFRLLKDGSWLVFYYRQQRYRKDPVPFDHGSFAQIVEIKNGTWEKIPLALDTTAWSFRSGKRPMIEDDAGGLWTVHNGFGLAYRSPEGEWKPFGGENGVPAHLRDLKLKKTQLWALERNRGVAVLDAEALQTWNADTSLWGRWIAATMPVQNALGEWVMVTQQEGGQVVRFGPKGTIEKIPTPTSGYVLGHTASVALDSEGGIWLFGSRSQEFAVAVYRQGRWQTHTRTSHKTSPTHALEEAFRTMASKSADFRVGVPGNRFYPAFSGDGRIVFRNGAGRVCYFDGQHWHAPTEGEEVKGLSLEGHPFFYRGKVAARFEEDLYVLEVIADKEGIIRSWKKVDGGPPPKLVKGIGTPPAGPLPPGCPLDPDEIEWKLTSGKEHWVGNQKRICVSMGGVGWHDWNIEGTPLAIQGGIQRVLRGPNGRLFFRHHGQRDIFTVYEVPTLEATALEDHLGTYDTFLLQVLPKIQTEVPSNQLNMRWKLEGHAAWSALQPYGPVQMEGLKGTGRHTLLVKLYGHDLSESKTMSFHLENTFDLQAFINTQVQNLGHDAYAEREAAEKILRDLGTHALNAVKQASLSQDPEVRLRATRLLEAIETEAATP